MKKVLVILLCFFILLAFAGARSVGVIKSVAPYAFYDLGNIIEIKGGWNYSDTKYESTVIYCDKELGICSDHTARLISKGHLLIQPIFWKAVVWEDNKVVALCTTTGLYQNSFLYIDRVAEKAYILKMPKGGLSNIENFDELEKVEELQDTFFESFCSVYTGKCENNRTGEIYGW